MTTMYDNRGKYFDAYAFNKAFDEYISKQTKKNELNDRVKTDDLSIVENIKIKPYEMKFIDIMINTKNTWINIFNNIKSGENLFNNLNYESIFYISITFILISLLYLFFYFIFE